MSEYHHGVKVIEINEGTRPIQALSTAVIGVVCVSEDADDTAFPDGKAVLITNPQALIAKAGSKGNLRQTLETISNIVRTPCVVVRVKKSITEESDEQGSLQSAIIGSFDENGVGSGIKAFESSGATLGVKPFILAVPTYDKKEVATALVATAKKSMPWHILAFQVNIKVKKKLNCTKITSQNVKR